jgi:alpha-glucosidase
MPMMQFSVAPWRVLDSVHLSAVKAAVKLRTKFTPLIIQLAHQAAETGEPIMKSMEYVFPGQGFEAVTDQFMLGDNLLVAPMLEKGKAYRNIKLPTGKWKAIDGNVLKGGKTYQQSVALDQMLYFEKMY